MDDRYDEEILGDSLPQCTNSEILVSVSYTDLYMLEFLVQDYFL